jgi:hypothetical protein
MPVLHAAAQSPNLERLWCKGHGHAWHYMGDTLAELCARATSMLQHHPTRGLAETQSLSMCMALYMASIMGIHTSR